MVLDVENVVLTDGEGFSIQGHVNLPRRLRQTMKDEGGLKSSRLRLAHKYATARPNLSKRERMELAIHGQPTGPPKEIDDPETEPAPKLALKRIRLDELPSSALVTAQDDLQRELEILLDIRSNGQSSFVHKNIVDLCGIGFDRDGGAGEQNPSSMSPGSFKQPSFLLLGQIRTTLTKRILKWQDSKGMGLFEALSLDVSNRRNQWVERLMVLSQIAHALQFLHSRQILYRDIKTDNVGFDALDVPKIFDFGLARKLTDKMRFRHGRNMDGGDGNASSDDAASLDDDELFQLTPETGTLRYMAVEVGTGRPYGFAADVYSFAILTHEILSLKVPFGGVPPRQFRQVVWTQGQRLTINPSWPATIQDMLPKLWHAEANQRPSMEEVVSGLDEMLRGCDQELFPKGMVPRGRRFSLF